MSRQVGKGYRENNEQVDEHAPLAKDGKCYALLAAVGNYRGISVASLPTCESDRKLIQSGLTKGLKFKNENIRVLGEDGYITAKVMANAIVEFSQIICEEDTFVLYFSGHGRNHALLFSDTGIELQSILNFVNQMPAKNKIVILDCCYSGDFQTDGVRKLSLEDEISKFAGHGIAIFASSAADEVSHVKPVTDDSSRVKPSKAAAVLRQRVKRNNAVSSTKTDSMVTCSAASEVYSIYTGFLSAAMMSPRIIKKGKISLQDIHGETCRLMKAWNETHPTQHQQPIFRSSMGGTMYFQVEEYHPYIQQKVYYETDRYIVCSVKPLSTVGIKRLAAFVILKECETITKEESVSQQSGEIMSKGHKEVNGKEKLRGSLDELQTDVVKEAPITDELRIMEELPTVTREIAEHIRHAEVYASEKSERRYGKTSARAIWCYFGRDGSDITKHLYFAYTVWAADDEARRLYYKTSGKHSYIANDICVFENISYKVLRKMQQSTQSREEFITKTRQLLHTIVNLAEAFIAAMQEIANGTRTIESVKEEYSGWIKDVKRQYLRLTDGEVPPDDLRAWMDKVEALAGNVLDLAILLEQTSEESFGGREKWLMEQAVKGYQRRLEELAHQHSAE